jgi:glycosyltransferase involved in cell wall biosynthesis
MGDKPTVNVIIPVYNGERFLAEAIQSVLDQTWPPDKIIVVDDGSTDRTAQMVSAASAKLAVPIQYVYQENQGPAAARNHGLRLATGALIAFQDADDVWAEGRLALQTALLSRYPAALAVFGQTRFFYEDSADQRIAPVGWFLGIHAGLFRRAAFEVVGHFNASLRYHEDIDWWRRAKLADAVIYAHANLVLYHRRHTANMTNDRAALGREFLRMLRQSPQAPTGDSLLRWLTTAHQEQPSYVNP